MSSTQAPPERQGSWQIWLIPIACACVWQAALWPVLMWGDRLTPWAWIPTGVIGFGYWVLVGAGLASWYSRPGQAGGWRRAVVFALSLVPPAVLGEAFLWWPAAWRSARHHAWEDVLCKFASYAALRWVYFFVLVGLGVLLARWARRRRSRKGP